MQNEPWGSEILKNSPKNSLIKDQGCAVCAIANLCFSLGKDKDPIEVNNSYVKDGLVNWKTVAALGASIVGIVLAAKVDKTDAKSALEHFAEVVFAPKHVITESED